MHSMRPPDLLCRRLRDAQIFYFALFYKFLITHSLGLESRWQNTSGGQMPQATGSITLQQQFALGMSMHFVSISAATV